MGVEGPVHLPAWQGWRGWGMLRRHEAACGLQGVLPAVAPRDSPKSPQAPSTDVGLRIAKVGICPKVTQHVAVRAATAPRSPIRASLS